MPVPAPLTAWMWQAEQPVSFGKQQCSAAPSTLMYSKCCHEKVCTGASKAAARRCLQGRAPASLLHCTSSFSAASYHRVSNINMPAMQTDVHATGSFWYAQGTVFVSLSSEQLCTYMHCVHTSRCLRTRHERSCT